MLYAHIYRIVLPFSVDDELKVVLDTFRTRNKFSDACVIRFVDRDAEAEKNTKKNSSKPSRILIMLGNGPTMRRMLDVAIKAQETYPDSESMARACYKVTNAFISARYNLKRVAQYVAAWEKEQKME